MTTTIQEESLAGLIDGATHWHNNGFQVVPTNSSGTKRPYGEWKKYQTERMPLQQLRDLLSTGRYPGIGVIPGKVSGNLEMLEIEGPTDARQERLGTIAEKLQTYPADVADTWRTLLEGCTEESAGGGLHIFYRVSDGDALRNTKLAMLTREKVIAETRGEGGFVITAPTPGLVKEGHAVGSAYRLLGDPANTPTITAEQRDLVHLLVADALDRVGIASSPETKPNNKPEPSSDYSAAPSVLDTYREQTTWREILEPEGWTHSHNDGTRDHWTRPGKKPGEGTSATTVEDGAMYCFSTSTVLPAEQGLSKGQVFAYLHHGGDLSRASRALLAQASPVRTTPRDTRPLADVLAEVRAFLVDYVVFPTEETATAAALWVAHAHALEAFDSTPRLAFLSPEPGSGKSRALEVIATLVPRPMHAVNATPAALFRSVGDDGESPTILFDEIDTVFGAKTADGNEDVRGFINAGHRRGAVAYRCVGMGTNQVVQAFPAYCAMALAGLDALPDTIATRSILVAMRKRAPHERVKPWRTRNEPNGHALRDALADALAPHMDALEVAEPVMPEGVEDRPADVWEPLLAIADAAGGEWPRAARAAATFLTLGRSAEPSRGVQLLTALHTIWEEAGWPEYLSTTDVLAALNAREEEPWPSMRGGQGIDARMLATNLGKYGVRSKTVRIGDATAKGYAREHLGDPWARYCSLPLERGNNRHIGNTPQESVTEAHRNAARDASHGGDPSQLLGASMGSVTPVTDVTASQGWEAEPLGEVVA